MNFRDPLKYYLALFLLATGLMPTHTWAVVGQETAFNRELNNRDDQALSEFVQSKENIEVKEKAKNLEISGDVRFEWQNIREKGVVYYKDEGYSGSGLSENYRNMRGGSHVDNDGVPISNNDFDIEFNLKIKYAYKDAWAVAQLQFDNPAGVSGNRACEDNYAVFNRNGTEVVEKIKRDRRFGLKGSGLTNGISLKRAFIGYTAFADGKQRVDFELGRRKLSDVFDSEIEFTSRFDGLLVRYASSFEEIFDWYCTSAVFIIDENVNHFGCVTEIGFLDIYETGIDLKYSFINWEKRGSNRCFIENPIGTRYQDSQVSVTYTVSQEIFDMEVPFEFYSGFLMNHAAKKTHYTHGKRENLGWYGGLYIGNVDKKGDWALDIEYIAVQAQAVPDTDVGSIGRGNILNEAPYDILKGHLADSSSSDSSSSDASSSRDLEFIGIIPRRGNSNFTGWRFEFLYAITDNLSIDAVYEFSHELNKKIGGRHDYSDIEIEIIYAF